jgi:hypothetical protein
MHVNGKVFISHSHADNDRYRRLLQELRYNTKPTVVGLVAGPNVDVEVLSSVTPMYFVPRQRVVRCFVHSSSSSAAPFLHRTKPVDP